MGRSGFPDDEGSDPSCEDDEGDKNGDQRRKIRSREELPRAHIIGGIDDIHERKAN